MLKERETGVPLSREFPHATRALAHRMLCLIRPSLPRLCTARLSLSTTQWRLLLQKSVSSSLQTDKFDSVGDIAAGLKEGLFRRVVVMSGAGVSTASGIPDFR